MALAVVPGWYWYHYNLSDHAAVQEFLRAHSGQVRLRKTFRGPANATEILIFEVVGGPLVWSLPDWPTPAPRKLDTGPGDIAKAAPNASPSLRATLEELVGKPFEAIRRTAENANTAVNILIFGGAAVLLYNLYQHTRAPAEAD